MAKSVTSALVGNAVEDGYIQSVDQKIIDFLPQFSDSVFADATVKDLLTMSSGILWEENTVNPNSDVVKLLKATHNSIEEFMLMLDPKRFNGCKDISGQDIGVLIKQGFLKSFFGCDQTKPVLAKTPGSYNQYKSADTQMLGLLIQAATGKTLAHYLQEKIWIPLGMRQKATWMADINHLEAAHCCIKSTARDFNKFTTLYINKGRYKGKQIIPEQWIVDSLSTYTPHLQAGKNSRSSSIWAYGYQWWMPPSNDIENSALMNEFSAVGIYNQYSYAFPKEKIVVTKFSAPPYYALSIYVALYFQCNYLKCIYIENLG